MLPQISACWSATSTSASGSDSFTDADEACLARVQIHNGYPVDSILDTPGARESYLLRYDGATRKLAGGYYDAWPSAVTKISANPPKYRFNFDIALPDPKVGDLMAVRAEMLQAARLTHSSVSTL